MQDVMLNNFEENEQQMAVLVDSHYERESVTCPTDAKFEYVSSG